MFSSIRDQSLSRRSRSFGVIKSGRSSKISLLSGITAASSGSNGSASTVTQDSYARIRSHPARARRKRKSRDGRSSVTSREERALKQMLGEEKKRSVDVFEFLVNDSKGEKGNDTVLSGQKKPIADDVAQESEPEGYYRSHLSDSGISMGGGSSVGDYPPADIPMVAPPSPFLGEPLGPPYSLASSSAECPYCEHENQMMWVSPPERVESFGQIDSRQSPHVRSGKHSAEHPKVDSVVAKRFMAISSAPKPMPIAIKDEARTETLNLPAYRGFKRLNARLLLQMQANLVELENHLNQLDDTGSTEEPSTETINQPTTKSKHKQKYVQDNSLLRAKIQKDIEKLLSQYYHALTITSRLNEISTVSAPAALADLKSWMTQNVKPASQAASILNDESDLICVRPSINPDELSPSSVIIALFALIDTLIPLIIFKFVSGVLNRLIVWTLVIAAGALTMDKLDLKSKHVQTNCTIAFGGISLGAALLL